MKTYELKTTAEQVQNAPDRARVDDVLYERMKHDALAAHELKADLESAERERAELAAALEEYHKYAPLEPFFDQNEVEGLCHELQDDEGIYPSDAPNLFKWLKSQEPSKQAPESVQGSGEVAEGCCELCGQPMPEGEEMFRYRGYSGPCPEVKP